MSEAREKLVKEIRDTAFDCFEFIGAGGKYLGCAAIDGLPLTPNDVAQIKQELVEGFNNYAAAESRLAVAVEALTEIKDVLDYGRRHSHGMYAFTKLVEGYNKADGIVAEALAKIQDTE